MAFPIHFGSTRTRRRVLAALLFFFVISSSFAQSSDYIIRHYTTNDGLLQNSVLHIEFDHNSYCWIATEAGLTRFDNKEFSGYNATNIPGLKDNRIRRLCITLQGQLYAKNLHEQEITISTENSAFASRPVILSKVSPYYFPKSGYATANDQIEILWDSLKKTVAVPLIRSHYATSTGDTYLTFRSQLFQILPQGSQMLKNWPQAPVQTVPVGPYLLQVWESHKAAVWKGGKLLFETTIRGDLPANTSFIENDSKLHWSPAGTFVFAQGDLFRIQVSDSTVSAKKVLSHLPMKAVSCVNYRPRSNIYYLGTLTDGLYIAKVSPFHYPQLSGTNKNNSTYAIGKTSKDELIVNNTVIPKNGPSYGVKFSEYTFRAFVDKSDWFYFQNAFDLYRYNSVSHQMPKIMKLDENLASILKENTSEDLLVCTRQSLTKLSISGPEPKILWQKQLPIPYNAESVNKMYPLNGNHYLLLTTSGIRWYNIQNNTSEKQILDSIAMYSFYRDRKNRYWFSGDGYGIFLYVDNKIFPLPKSKFDKLSSVIDFIDDGRGNFWLPTNNGLYSVEIEKLAAYIQLKTNNLFLYTINNLDGLRTNEFNGAVPSYQWLSDSTLALASMNGLVEFKPKSLRPNYPGNNIFIDDFWVDSVKIMPKSLKNPIRLSPDFNLMKLKIGSPYYGNPQNNHLEYAIHRAGTPVQWEALPVDGILTVNNLPSGSYIINFRNKEGSQNAENQQLNISFDVIPHFYNTWEFYLSVIVLIILICFVIFRWRLRRLEKDKQRIEAIVIQRTKDLEKTTRQLQISEKALQQSNKQKEQIITMVLHDLRSPLRFLKTVTNGIMHKFQEEISTSLSDSLQKLNGSAVSLWEFTDRFFTWAVTQKQDFKIQESEFELQEVFNLVASFYMDIVMLNNNRLQIEATSLICHTDKNILMLILRNLVDNANKNTFGGIISLRATADQKQNHIIITDQGSGMLAEQIQMFQTGDGGNEAHSNKHIGSQVIYQMLLKINGQITINTSEKGTTFTISLKKRAASHL